MPILHDAHVTAYYEAIDFEPWYHRDSYEYMEDLPF